MKLLNNAVIRLTKNRKPAYDPENELMWDRTYNSSSWFVIGHFEAEGHKLNYLYHQMVWQDKDGSLKLNSVIGVTDETTGEYLGEDKFYPMDQTKFAEDHFGIIVPNGSMEGDLRNMRVTAFMEHASLDLELEFEDGIIMNGGAGEFSIAVIGVKQYSKPRIKPTGTLVLNGKTYPISGDAWFDRQWQKVPTQKSKTGEGSDDPVTGGTIHWYWMDLKIWTTETNSVSGVLKSLKLQELGQRFFTRMERIKSLMLPHSHSSRPKNGTVRLPDRIIQLNLQ